ncbi:hypothetical protein [Sporosarcina sp. FA9]
MTEKTKMSKEEAAELAKRMIENGKKYGLPAKKLKSKKIIHKD